jgi:hypothetical protein
MDGGVREGKRKEKQFFFEKKNQKTFGCLASCHAAYEFL